MSGESSNTPPKIGFRRLQNVLAIIVLAGCLLDLSLLAYVQQNPDAFQQNKNLQAAGPALVGLVLSIIPAALALFVLQVRVWVGWLVDGRREKQARPPIWHLLALILFAFVVTRSNPTATFDYTVTLPPSKKIP